jgi:hypothetical protein
MFDYNKLKEAHELLKQVIRENKSMELVTLQSNFIAYADGSFHDDYSFFIEGGEYKLYSINELIDKLRQLTQPKPKYDKGDKVWVLGNLGGFHKTTIKTSEYGTYTLAGHADVIYTDKDIFKSREDLIETQIKYWTCLKKDAISTCSDDVSMECEHASDGHPFSNDGGLTEIHKCKKCGEFHR